MNRIYPHETDCKCEHCGAAGVPIYAIGKKVGREDWRMLCQPCIRRAELLLAHRAINSISGPAILQLLATAAAEGEMTR